MKRSLLALAFLLAGVPAAHADQSALRALAGPGAIVDVDPVTGTPRQLAKRDGFLSAPTAGAPSRIALGWVRTHRAALGLRSADLRRLHLTRSYRSPDGVTHLTWQQRVRGIPAIDSMLRVHVDGRGRIVAVQGSPRPGLGEGISLTPLVAKGPGRSHLVFFKGRLAWRSWVENGGVVDVVTDARSGKVLRKADKVKDASAKVWEQFPGAAKGGVAVTRDISRWLSEPDRLIGPNSHTYADIDGTDTPNPLEEVVPGEYSYAPVFSPFGQCPKAGCSWNHLLNGSWLGSIEQAATQSFYFVNRFKEHLEAAPIGFTRAAGNFEGDDPVITEPLDSAAQVAGRPVPLLMSDNANMATPPDGESPRMQMYLFEPIDVPGVIEYPFSDVHGGDDASVVYHEYTHGLSNRLITDAEGVGALDSVQSGAMGEAWSDFYAFDFLMAQGLVQDTDAPGELRLGEFVDGGQSLVRSEPLDCRPGDPASACPRKRVAAGLPGTGGYTYKDFGKILGSPQVHADGEIWGQTLFDLRRRLVAELGDVEGTRHTQSLVTRGMDLSPPEPSFIDMRNAILQADKVAGGEDLKAIWETFAARGMGEDAKSKGGTDETPIAGFRVPAGLPDRPVKVAPAAVAPAPAATPAKTKAKRCSTKVRKVKGGKRARARERGRAKACKAKAKKRRR